MHLYYHVEPHDEGWAYRLGDVWSEAFPDHAGALGAARAAAERQQQGGSDTCIIYETADYKWITEKAFGGDRPEVEVTDEYPGLA
jgi:hypothetical protein